MKKLALLLIILILAITITIFLFYPANKYATSIGEFFSSNTYTVLKLEDNRFLLTEKFLFKRSEGTALISDQEVIEFHFDTQSIIKTIHGKWRIFLQTPEFEPGSPEDLTRLSFSEMDLDRLYPVSSGTFCIALEIPDSNCKTLAYDTDEGMVKFTIDKEQGQVVGLEVDTNGGVDQYIISDINNPEISVGNLFLSVEQEIKDNLVISE